jgi:3-oxoadipate enol-lactonase
MRNIVLLGQEPDDREVALIGLVKACELVNEIFAKGERKAAKKRSSAMTHVYVNGFKMYYETAGEGTPLLLLHGLGSSHEDWILQTSAFSEAYRVIVPDCRGHGESEKPPGPYSIELFASDVAALLEHLGVEQAHVLGLSMGGMVAQQLALDMPQQVKSLVLVNTFSHLMTSGPGALWALLRRALILRLLSMERMGRLVGRQLFPKPEQEELRQLTAQRWARNDKAAYRAASMAVWRFNVTWRLGEIYCPTLIIAGKDDVTVPPPHREVLQRGITGSELVVIPDSTHATPIDRAQLFNATILKFLASVADVRRKK